MRLARTPLLTPLVGGLLGATLFFAVLGPALLRPTNLGWLMRHDTQTYLLAWHHFRRERWQWPPGRITGVGYPVSTSIGNTDAIPLLAFPLKPLHGLLPDPAQYLGAWLLACFVLQGVFGALLVRRVTADRLLQVFGAALFVQTPALLFRNGHTALCGHWLLLASLWICLSHRDRGRRWRLTAWAVVSAAAAATQPYLAVMVLGLAVADLVSDAVWPRPSTSALPSAAAGVALVVAVTAAVLWMSGIFLVGSADHAREGLGVYSMNLLSPVNSMKVSMFLPELPVATGGQYEGMVYFGVGWLGLTAAALATALRGRGAAPALRLNWAVVAVFLVYAISPVVTVGSQVLVDVTPWTPNLVSVFRSSGRFAWLAMYVTFTVVLVTLLKATSRRTATALIAVGLALQTVDLTRAYVDVRAREHSRVWTMWDDPLKHPVWDLALPHYKHLVLTPPDICVGPGPEAAGPHLPFSLHAGSHGVTINSGNAGRYAGGAVIRYCLEFDAAMRAGRMADDTLYVVSPKLRDIVTRATRASLACGTADGFEICVTEASSAPWRDAALARGFTLTSVLPARR